MDAQLKNFDPHFSQKESFFVMGGWRKKKQKKIHFLKPATGGRRKKCY